MSSWTIDFWKKELYSDFWSSVMCKFLCFCLYAFAFRSPRHYVFGCPSIWNTLFPPVNGSVGPFDQPWTFFGLSFHLSVHLLVHWDRFLCFSQRTHGGNGLKFCMLMNRDHLQKLLDFGDGLLIFFLLASLWRSERSQIWGFRAFPGEPMEGMAFNFTCWCILNTCRTD